MVRLQKSFFGVDVREKLYVSFTWMFWHVCVCACFALVAAKGYEGKGEGPFCTSVQEPERPSMLHFQECQSVHYAFKMTVLSQEYLIWLSLQEGLVLP